MNRLADWKLPILLLVLLLTNLAGILEEYAKVDPLACEDCKAVLSGITFEPSPLYLYLPGDGPKPSKRTVTASATKSLNWQILEEPDPEVARREGDPPSKTASWVNFTFLAPPSLVYKDGGKDKTTSFRLRGRTPEDEIEVGPETLKITLVAPEVQPYGNVSPEPMRAKFYVFEEESGKFNFLIGSVASEGGWAVEAKEIGKSNLFQTFTTTGESRTYQWAYFGRPDTGVLQEVSYVANKLSIENCRSPIISSKSPIPIGCWATINVSAQVGGTRVSRDLRLPVLLKSLSG